MRECPIKCARYLPPQFLIDTVDAAVPPLKRGGDAAPDAASAGGPGAAYAGLDRAPPAAIVNATLALQALFVLVQTQGLEYPRFYAAVYALLHPATLAGEHKPRCSEAPPRPPQFILPCPAAKHRGRFLALLDLVLSSPLLPAYLVAAFAKRAARLALAAPATVRARRARARGGNGRGAVALLAALLVVCVTH